MNLITRDYRTEDFEAVNYIWQQTGMGGAIRGDDQDVILRTIEMGGRLILLENTAKNEIIGTSWVTQDGRRIYLHHFGILPDYQGKGFAKILLDASLKFAKGTGLQIKLEVHEDNEIARNLYVKGGFKYLGDYNVYIIRKYDNL